MSEIVIALGYFALGFVVAVVAMLLVVVSDHERIGNALLHQVLDKKGYALKDGKIVEKEPSA